MSLPALLLSGYLLAGLIFALTTVTGRGKKTPDFRPSDEPDLFWLYLFLWPLAALFRSITHRAPDSRPHLELRVKPRPVDRPSKPAPNPAPYFAAIDLSAVPLKLPRRKSDTTPAGTEF